MLFALAQWLQGDFHLLRVFNYLSFRAVMAALTALAMGLACGPRVIRLLHALQVGHAHDGRRSDTDWHCRIGAALGESGQSFRLGCDGGDNGIWMDWLGR